MRNEFRGRIDKLTEGSKDFLEQYEKKLLKDYERIVSNLDKKELVSRLVTLAEGKLNAGDYSYNWLMNDSTDSRNLWEAMDIDGFFRAHKIAYDDCCKKFRSKRESMRKELDAAVMKLRDQINLGAAEEALKMLSDFQNKWEKAISALEAKR